VEDLQSDMNNRMLESIDTINSLKVVEDIGKYMFFEKRKASGTHHFHGLLHAIKNRIVLQLKHQRFDCEAPTERLVHPYALKESKGRWYLFAKDTKDHRLKTFGLDRILVFENTPGRFDYPAGLDIHEHFLHCFGVINPDDQNPEKVILSFDPDEGKYIKSYPFHESQVIITDNEKELRISLFIYITHDLVMELLSFGEHFTVVSPAFLKRMISEVFTKAVERNS
jgi:predicted DNA-binding transcriptional regulator YafY